MDDDNNSPTLGDFFFHTGDNAAHTSALDDLFVCYTLTRGLQREATSPRRPALPLELILRITRFAGFVDASPDPALTLFANIPFRKTPEVELFTSQCLSRKHVLSMARIHLVPLKGERPPHMSDYAYDTLFSPVTQCRLLPNKAGSSMILTPLLPRNSGTRPYRLRRTKREVSIPNDFTPEYTQQYFNQDKVPEIYIVAGLPTQILFWRWWEPKF